VTSSTPRSAASTRRPRGSTARFTGLAAGLAATGSGVWIAARPFPSASHRGGTLTVVNTYLPNDPVAVRGRCP
jgi:hypothetical protein